MSYSIGLFSKSNKCAVVGCSGAGAVAAYALSQNPLIDALVLLDMDKRTAQGLAADLNCASDMNARIDIWAGEYADLSDCALIILSVGYHCLHECTTADLLSLNLPIIRNTISDIAVYNRDAIILVVSQPCEILTYAIMRYSGFPLSHVIGIGTLPQTLYFRKMLGKFLGADARQIDVLILGQSDENGILCLSDACINGLQLESFLHAVGRSYETRIIRSLFEDAMQTFLQAESAKGCAEFAVGRACSLIASCIFEDSNTLLPLCTIANHNDALSQVCMSLPCMIGRQGVKQLDRLPHDFPVLEQLRQTAANLRMQMLDADHILQENKTKT